MAYIYFDYQERDRQRPEHILASLIKQLVNQLSTLPIDLDRLHGRVVNSGKLMDSGSPEELEDLKKILTINDLYEVLVSTFGYFRRVFLVFDALDECAQRPQRNVLLPLFHRMGKDGACLFLTSRRYPEDIQTSFCNVAKIELVAQDEDIRQYVQEKINENPRAKRLLSQANCEERIISELTGHANGM